MFLMNHTPTVPPQLLPSMRKMLQLELVEPGALPQGSGSRSSAHTGNTAQPQTFLSALMQDHMRAAWRSLICPSIHSNLNVCHMLYLELEPEFSSQGSGSRSIANGGNKA